MARNVLDAQQLLDHYGDFHDARVEAVRWAGTTLDIWLDDVNSAFAQTSEERAESKGAIHFVGVSTASFSVEPARFTSIYSVELDSSHSPGLIVNVALSPAGRVVVQCEGFDVSVDSRESDRPNG